MMGNKNFIFFNLAVILLFVFQALAASEGTVSGTVFDAQGIAIGGATVQILNSSGQVVKEATTSAMGTYQFSPVESGDYQLSIRAASLAAYGTTIHVAEGQATSADATLAAETKEMVLNVKAKRHLVKSNTSSSSTEVNKDQISSLPEGETVKLPKLMATTSPGIVAGPFGQSYIRGNHANIQYQIDGVQLPDSPSNSFGEAFTPRNIDHMEVITGGIPAEYGQRLAAVVNIATKSGTEVPNGELQLDYGSYNTSTPYALFSGSNASGDLHYFISAGFSRTDRGLDTPEPQAENNENQGGWAAVHDMSWGDNEFAKIDWLYDNTDKFSFILFNSFNYYQIPNFPNSFLPTDAFFQSTFVDPYGNGPVNWVPSTTDDDQQELNTYFQIVWKKTFSETSFLQIAPYYRYSYVGVSNDINNDLASANVGPNQIGGAQPSSLTESRPVNNYGLKTDYTERLSESHLLKTGFQLQNSQSGGGITVTTTTAPVVFGNPSTFVTSTDNSSTLAYYESVYAQDDWSISKSLILNLGLRFDAVQFNFGTSPATYSADNLLQPRIGVNYLLTDTTKVHAFYGKLFQPAPAEDLRDTFVNIGAGPSLSTYDIKAEKDDYYEVGLAQQWGEHVFSLNGYYKNAVNMLDDTQLLNTSIAQPYNFAVGFAYGVEFSVKGEINSQWSDYFNYSYEIAKGNGISGGLFTGVQSPTDWTFLDHVQIQTANLGVTYKLDHWWASGQSLFGSGLRTGPDNITNLPAHLTFDATLGYEFKGETWWEKFKLSADVLNITNNAYPITIANGFNGSHYAAGTEFFAHLNKEL
jgi:outer membrane receptor protein involved in Fe transport